DSGRALAKMQAIIEAQGKQTERFEPGHLTHEIKAPRNGVVSAIDNYQMSKIARLAGAPMDKGAGVDLLKKLGDPVKKGESLYRIHAEFPADFNFASTLANNNSGYRIGDEVAAEGPPP
ncbi:MAG TPA: thymidine phosphorylase, partial [Chromatiales bacterium]|nr:thymidine phosphorylase [Chromatiales bacterium]HEX21824.1 thymidine phosphorylase [Chromatiales bacterium]